MTATARTPALATLVAGGRAGQREAAIAAALLPGQSCAVILEGLADGNSVLANLADLAAASDSTELAPPGATIPQLLRIAPGCLCCAGNLVLRVTLNRLLRQPPQRIFISLADATHIDTLRAWLQAPPYDAHLALGPDLLVDAAL